MKLTDLDHALHAPECRPLADCLRWLESLLSSPAVQWDGDQLAAATEALNAAREVMASDVLTLAGIRSAMPLEFRPDKGQEGWTPGSVGAGRPIPMVLHCPACLLPHVDMPNPAKGWTDPPHRSHRCQSCDHEWRPADVPTAGVLAIHTRGENDSPLPATPYRFLVPVNGHAADWDSLQPYSDPPPWPVDGGYVWREVIVRGATELHEWKESVRDEAAAEEARESEARNCDTCAHRDTGAAHQEPCSRCSIGHGVGGGHTDKWTRRVN